MADVNRDRTGVEILDDAACERLLASSTVGRVGFVAEGDVVILPVTYGMDSSRVVFRTANGEKLHAAVLGRAFSFEIDGWDATTRSGWSVLIKGVGEEVWRADEVAALEKLDVEPWTNPEARTHWIRIRPDEVSGRRVTPAPTP